MRIVLTALGACIVLGGLVHLLHGFQLEKNADALKLRAGQLTEEGEKNKAIRHYRNYVKLRPNDLEAWTALGSLLEETAETPRQYMGLYLANEQILRLEPDTQLVRRRQAETAMALRNFKDARIHWERLLKNAPQDGELEFQLGLCDEYMGKWAEALGHYRRGVELGHNDPPVFLRMARLQHGSLKQPAEADKTIDQMMLAHPDSAEAFRTRALYRRALGLTADALADANAAAQRAPEDTDALLLAAELTTADPKSSPETLDRLLETLEEQRNKSPDETKLYELSARIYVRQGKAPQAIEMLQRGRNANKERIDLTWQLADLLIVEGRVDEARKELEVLRAQDAPEIPLSYLEARILMSDGEFVQAKKILEHVQSQVNRESLLFRFSSLHLGACYGRMGQHNEQLDACRQVLLVDPQSMEAQLGSAAALEALGRADEAIQIYRRYRTLPGVPLRLARLLFNREMRRANEERDWRPFEEALNAADAASPGSVDVTLLRSAFARAQGGPQQPQPTLESLKRDQPADIRVWIAAAMAAMRDTNWEKSLQLLDEGEKSLGDSVTLRLARAAYWSRTTDENANAALAALEGKQNGFPKNERLRLLEGLATIHFLRGDMRSARRLWQDVAANYPDHVQAQFRLLRLAIGLNDNDEIKRRLLELQRIEGEEGSRFLVGKALHSIAQARAGKSVALDQSADLLDRAEKAQPGWAIVQLAQAEIAELNSNPNEALERYLHAIELENRDPDVLRRTFGLLLSRRRIAEAKRLIAQLLENAPVSTRGLLLQLQVEVAVALRDLATAKREIPKAVPAETDDFRLQLWRGRMLAATNQPDAAATAYETAVRLAPNQPDSWAEQIAFLSRSGRMPAAEEALKEAEKQLTDPGTELALARCYEATGKRDKAEGLYLKWMGMRSNSLAARRTVVEFYLRTGQAGKAEQLLAPLFEGQADNKLMLADLFWARRSMAKAKASQDYSQFREALDLLDENIKSSSDSTDDQRLKARLLASRPHPDELRDANRILDSLASKNLLGPEDRRLLATICDRLEEKQAAAAHWTKLVEEQRDQPEYVAAYINRLLANKEVDTAEKWLDRLEKLDPESLRTVSLRAAWLVLRQRTDDALQRLEAYADQQQPSAANRSTLLLQIARVLEQLANESDQAEASARLLTAAEKLYGQSVESHPELLLQFGMFLSRQGRIDEALDCCSEALPSVPVLQVTAAAVVIVRQPLVSADQIARVDQWITNAIQDNPNSVAAQVQLAEFRLSHERYEDSAKIYTNILRQIPNHIVALNNLAWLMSVWKGDHAAAENMVQRAIDRAGPLPALLDTRGSISLGRGNLSAALNDFRTVVTQDSSSTARYHLALAYWKSKNLTAARFNFEKAEEAGLTSESLYPLERADYEKIRQDLKLPADSTDDR